MQDLRLALRQLLRRPGPSLAAILSLALGIGANAAIYSVLHAVVLRPLPYPEAASLVDLAETSPDAPIRAVAPANFFDWQRQLTAVSAIAAYDEVALVLTGRREPERLRGVSVSGAFFPLLGVTAAAGRTLGPTDDAPGAPCVAVLGHGLAARLSGTAVGSPLTLDGHLCVAVGVLPETFTFAPQRDAEIWISSDRGVPRDLAFAGDVTTVRDAHYLSVVARLRPGVSAAAAGAEAQAVMTRLAAAYPATNTGLGAVATPLHARIVGPVQPVILGLQVAVLLLLLIACANVAHLLLGQAAGRQGEIATRVALGAGCGRLVRQLLGEALALAVPGGVLGLLLAAWGLDALVALAPASVPRLAEVRLDAAVLGVAALLTLATAAAFGLGPALQLVRVARLAGLQGTRVAGSRGTRRWQRLLMIGELATAQLLLVGAAWLLSSAAAAQDVPLGYVPGGRIAVDLNLSPGRYLRPSPGTEGRVDARAKWQMLDAVLAELDATPGVRGAAAALAAPLGGVPNRGVRLDDAPATPGVGPTADFQLVTSAFFRTLGIPLERGRGFVDADREDAPPVAVVNRAFADRYLPGADPLGHVIVFGGDRRHEIVGVAADARYRDVERPAAPTVYVPLRQNDERWGTVSLLVWSDGDPLRHWRRGARRAATRRPGAAAVAPAHSRRHPRRAARAAPVRHGTGRRPHAGGAAAGGGRCLRRRGPHRRHAHARIRRAQRARRIAGAAGAGAGRRERGADFGGERAGVVGGRRGRRAGVVAAVRRVGPRSAALHAGGRRGDGRRARGQPAAGAPRAAHRPHRGPARRRLTGGPGCRQPILLPSQVNGPPEASGRSFPA